MVLQCKKDTFNLDVSKYTGTIGKTMQLILCTKKCLGFVVYPQKHSIKWQGTSRIICEMKQSSIQKGRKKSLAEHVQMLFQIPAATKDYG